MGSARWFLAGATLVYAGFVPLLCVVGFWPLAVALAAADVAGWALVLAGGGRAGLGARLAARAELRAWDATGEMRSVRRGLPPRQEPRMRPGPGA